MNDRKSYPPTPMPKIMLSDEVAAKLGEASYLLKFHGEVGAAITLKRILDGELKIWSFHWRMELREFNENAANVLGDDHRAIALVRDVLRDPLPILLDEHPVTRGQ